MNTAFDYIKANGIMLEKDYPYKAVDQTCRYKSKKKAATVTGHVDVPSGDENALVSAIAAAGPLTVAIDAGQRSFQFYSSGVYNEPACTNELNHAVTVVGYDTDSTYGDYYIVKNSWSTGWGDK